MYLDCDTTPPLKSHYVSKAYTLDTVIKIATDFIGGAAEGQIGIYNTPRGDGFRGYVIKYAGKPPYFERAEG
jgi:hypothetical protein